MQMAKGAAPKRTVENYAPKGARGAFGGEAITRRSMFNLRRFSL
jgi:hypothetical protein